MTSDEFKALRKRMRLSQTRLANLIDIAQPSIARIESGRRQPTKQQAILLHLVDFLIKHGLLDEWEREKSSGKRASG